MTIHRFTSSWRTRAKLATLLLSSALAFQACSDSKDPKDDNGEEDPNDGDNGDNGKDDTPDPAHCDPIDPSVCSLPWPSNLYLAEDDSTATGARLKFGATSLPKGKKRIDPSGWEILDGYGLSTPILFKAPNLDLSDLPTEDDASASWDGEIGNAQLFEVLDDDSLERVPFWMEYDLNEGPEEGLYYMRPAVVLKENARYIVMLRNLENTDGEALERSEAFDALVRGETTDQELLVDRQERFDAVFDLLETKDIDRDELYLAWDFNTASHEALHGPLLHARDLVLDALDGQGPEFTVRHIKTYQRDDAAADNYNPYIRYEISGKFTTPEIVRPKRPGNLLNFDDNGDIAIRGEVDKDFWVNIPYSAVGENAETAHLMHYGHGLMNAGNEITLQSQERMAEIHNYIYFAGNWTGMSIPDFFAVQSALADFSNFRMVSDNMHQGLMEFIVLAKMMKHGFFEHEDIQALDVHADPDAMAYSGHSQGGIYGPTYLAISPDIQVGHMGVPGSNYNMLLQRSTAFNMYAGIALPTLDQDYTKLGIALAAAQSLWDMVDANSWYIHLEQEPIDEPKYALLHPARGDYQVSPLTNLIVANSDYNVNVFEGWGQDISHWGLEEIPFGDADDPYKGSGIVIYNAEQEWPPLGNIHPEDLDDDPHGRIRYFHDTQIQADHFLRSGGEIIDVCDGGPCDYVPMSSEDCDALLAAEPGPGTRGTQCWELAP